MQESKTVNPYAAPLTDDTVNRLAKRRDGESAYEVFIAWEKLRLFYNGALLAGLCVFFPFGGKTHVDAALSILGIMFVANVCFCAGQVVEGYFDLMGVPRRYARIGLFVVGAALPVVYLAVASVAWVMMFSK